MPMTYFIHNFLTKNVSAAIAAIFRVTFLQEYKGTNVFCRVVVTP